MSGSQRCFCSGVPWASSVGPDEVDADAADELGRPGPRQLLGHDVVLDRRRRRARRTPRASATPTQRPSASLRLPLAPERDLLGEVVEAGRQPLAVLPRQVGPQPVAHLGAQRRLVNGPSCASATSRSATPVARSSSTGST